MATEITETTNIEKLQYNPFLHDLILEKVYEHLSSEDLKNCRLVCTKWLNEATRALQQTLRNVYIVFGYLRRINMFQMRPDIQQIKLFIHAMENSVNVPYVNFELRPNMLAPINKPLVDEFLTHYGSIIQRLAITLAYESADEFSEDCLKNVTFTNLLDLEFSNNLRGELRPNLKTGLLTTRKNLFSSILHTACNLQSIFLWADNENLVWPGEVLDVICQNKLSQLKHLRISLPCNEMQLGKLENLRAHLTSLIFVLRKPLVDTTALTTFLEFQRKSLKCLTIIDSQCDHPKEIRLPRVMEHITEFTVEGAFYGDNCQLSLSGFSYKTFPKLRKLHFISCNEFNMDFQPFFYNSSCVTLKELQIELSINCIDSTVIRLIPQTFPNMTRIRLIFSPESRHLLGDVFQSLFGLEEMTLDLRKCASVNLDDVMVGLRPVCDDRFDCNDQPQPFDEEYKKLNYGISTLTSLKYLTVVGEYKYYNPGEFAFTDESLIHGIFLLPNLKNIRMWKSGFSNNGLQTLRSKYNFLEPSED